MARLRQIEIDVDVHRVIEQARQSFAQSDNDILRELLLGRPPVPIQRTRHGTTSAPTARTRGLWSVEVTGEWEPASNLKDAYRTLLLKLDTIAPGFMERFASERSRSRRFVAREPADLYNSSPHLAADYAQPLRDGWYFDTNLSAEQVATRARIASRVAGLLYGRDVKLMENLKVI